MPDFISRKRLKKKALDRWENEGGKFSAYPTDQHSSNRRKKKRKGKSRILQSSITVSESAAVAAGSRPK